MFGFDYVYLGLVFGFGYVYLGLVFGLVWFCFVLVCSVWDGISLFGFYFSGAQILCFKIKVKCYNYGWWAAILYSIVLAKLIGNLNITNTKYQEMAINVLKSP